MNDLFRPAPLAGIGPDPRNFDHLKPRDLYMDPIETAAIALEALSWHTPDDVVAMLTATASLEVAGDRWLHRLDPATRSLYRRRAAIARAALQNDEEIPA